MKIILLRDIAKMGKKFDVKEVANGHAQHLIRTGAAELATPARLSQLSKMQQAHAVAEGALHDKIASAIEQVVAEGISIVARANEQGHLFEALTAHKLAEAIADSIVELPEDVIALDAPIKEVGEYEIVLTHGDVSKNAKLVVSAEQ